MLNANLGFSKAFFYLNRLELDNQNKLTCKRPQKTLFAFDNSFYFIYMLYIIYKLYILFYSILS